MILLDQTSIQSFQDYLDSSSKILETKQTALHDCGVPVFYFPKFVSRLLAISQNSVFETALTNLLHYLGLGNTPENPEDKEMKGLRVLIKANRKVTSSNWIRIILQSFDAGFQQMYSKTAQQ